MLSGLPDGRRILLSAGFCACLAIVVLTIAGGLSQSFPVRLVQVAAIGVAGVGVIGAVIAVITTRLSDYRDPPGEDDFERLVRHSERLAAQNLAAEPDEG